MKRKMFLSAIALLLANSAWGQEQEKDGEQEEKVIHQAFPERVPLDPQKIAQKPPVPATLNVRKAFQEGRNIHDVGPVSPERIAEADEAAAKNRPGLPRVAVVRTVLPAPLSIEKSFTEMVLPGGRKVWTLAIRSPGAFGVRIHFTKFDVGRGSVLVYAPSPDGVIVRGPYTRKGRSRSGDFWTGSLPGDVVYIEITHVAGAKFEIPEILHFDRDPASPGDRGEDGAQSLRGLLPCHLDVMCSGGNVDRFARDATGQMNFISGGSGFVCSGTLLNDLDSETFMPYFLTARHCLATQAEVNTLEVVWLWQKDSCSGTLPSYNSLPRNMGGTVVRTNSSNDMTFIRLDGALPGAIGLAGWTTEHPAVPYGIHHPGGSWKRLTFLAAPVFCPGCIGCDPGGQFLLYYMTAGIVEGGSSGSGVFNLNGQLAGQLWGHCCPELTCAHGILDCDHVAGWVTKYGEFDTTYPIIEQWLKIGGTIRVNGANITPPWYGTPADPFWTVSQANAFAWDGARIKIQAGSYSETLTFSKELTVLAAGGTVTIGE